MIESIKSCKFLIGTLCPFLMELSSKKEKCKNVKNYQFKNVNIGNLNFEKIGQTKKFIIHKLCLHSRTQFIRRIEV